MRSLASKDAFHKKDAPHKKLKQLALIALITSPWPATLCAALLATLNAGVCADPVKTPQSQNISANVFSMDASIH